MNIQDILRGLPFPVQGALMSLLGAQGHSSGGARQPMGAVQEEGSYDAMGNYTGMGQGILSQPDAPTPVASVPAPAPQAPIVQMPQAAPSIDNNQGPVASPVAAAMAPLPVREIPAMPQPAPRIETPQEPVASPVAAAMAPAPDQSGEGLLSRFGFQDGNQALMAFGGALAAAGSQDPAKTALAIQAQRAEEAKIAEARRRGNQPKIEPITGTPFFQITYPDGRMETVNNPALAKFYQEQSASKAANKRSDMELQADLNVKAAEGKAGIKAADEARPQLAQVRETITTMQRALAVTNEQGTWDQVQAVPLISGVAEFFGTPGAAGNKVLQQLKVDDALRNTAQTKGAISNQEMDLFLSPAPSPTADRQTIWKPWIENKISVFKRLEKTLESEVARAPSSGGAPAAATATPAPAASGGVARPASKADYDALPKGAKYIAPNGMELTKK